MEMKTAISCTILRHTKILRAVGLGIISLVTIGSKNHTTNITNIVPQSIGIIIKRLLSVVSQRESVKNDKPTISMSLSHCIHQTLNSKASTRFHSGGLQQSLTLILNTFLFGVIILIANILKRAVSSQLAAKLRNRLLVLLKPFFVPFGAVDYNVINIKLGEHIVALCQFIHYLLSNRYKLITNVSSSLMAVNIHITIIELNALHTKRQNLFQDLDAVIHLLMEAKHWGLRKSRNATSLNSRFKSLDTLKVKIISETFTIVIRTNHKKASKNWKHEKYQPHQKQHQ